MKVHEIQNEILRMKREKDVCILAHAYQSQDVLEVADYVGDSYGLSKQAVKDERQEIIMCGVRFMAETCKILNPQKRCGWPTRWPVARWRSSSTLPRWRNLRKNIPDMRWLLT